MVAKLKKKGYKAGNTPIFIESNGLIWYSITEKGTNAEAIDAQRLV